MVHRAFGAAVLACTLMVAAFAAAAQVPMRVEATSRQPDGKILIAGQGTSAETPKRIVIGRLNADGSLDPSFVSGGWLTYVTDPGVSEFRVTALAVAPDGKIVVALVRDSYPGLLRLDGYGSLDSTFGTVSPGLVVDDSIQGLRVNALTILANGDILGIGGYTGTYTNNVTTPAIVRFTNYGPRDFYFGSGPAGVKLPFWGFNQNEAELRAAADWGNGTAFVTAGYVNRGGTHWFLVARFFVSGDLDYSFANGGWSMPVDGDAVALTVEPGASITATGHDAHTAFGHDANNFVVAQLDAYGYPGYGLGYTAYNGILRGHLWIDDYWDASATAVSAARIPGSSDILVAGTGLQTTTGRAYFFTSRIDVDSTAPYGWDAKANPRTGADDFMTGAYPTPDGQQIVAVGTRDSLGGENALRVRYFADTGEFDTDFPAEGTDATPNPIAFVAVTGAGPSEVRTSIAVRVTGINVPTLISTEGGTYSIGCAGPYAADPGTIVNGQAVCVQLTSASTPLTTTTATLTVGGVQGAYSVTTGSIPDTSITSGPSSPGGASAQFYYSADSASGGGQIECRLDGAPFALCNYYTKSYTGLGNGPHTFEARAVNAWGTDPTPASFAWTVLLPPETTLTSTPASPSNATVAVFAFTSDDANALFDCKMDNAAFARCVSPASYPGLTNGSHFFQVRAVNSAGQDTSPATFSWTLDTVAPIVTLVGPSGYVANASATFTFGRNDASASLECQLDGAAFAPCASPLTLSGLAEGAHSFTVRSNDAAGNVGAAAKAWTVDTIAPDTTVSGPSGLINRNSATILFSSNESGANFLGATFQCSLDGAGFASCSPAVFLSNLAQGPHTFQVRAVDLAGNVDSTPASLAFTVDTIAPDVSITAGPAEGSLSSSSSVSFTFASSEPTASFICVLDSGAFSPCANPIVFANVADGSHFLSVAAIDAAGNSTWPVLTRSFKVDVVAPAVTIDSGPTGVSGQTVTFAFSANKPAVLQCSVDASVFANCASPFTLGPLADGAHSFGVLARDQAGVVSAPAWRYWTVDSQAPTVTIDSGPTGVSGQTVTFAFSASEPAFLECSVDASAFASCASPFTLGPLAGGAHSFAVRATDTAGNVSAPVIRNWTVDAQAPQSSITSGPSAQTSSQIVTFTFASDDASAAFECSIDGGAYSACASPKSYTGLTETNHSFSVRAIDSVGNVDPTPDSYSWIVDLTAPDTLLSSGPGEYSTLPSATFTFQGYEPNVTFQCSLDGAAFAACTSPATYGSLADGSHTFGVRAVDLAGNVDASPSSLTWTVDTLSPETTITSSPPAVTNQYQVWFSFTSSEANPQFECRVDGQPFASCPSPVRMTTSGDGPHTFDVRARDAAGNTDATPASYSWTLDTVAPTTTLTGKPAATTSNTTATFTFTSNEPGTFECRLDGAADFSACTSPLSLSGLAIGSHTLIVRARDIAGNTDPGQPVTTWTVTPETTITSGPSGTSASASASFSFTGTGTGVTFSCALDGAAFAVCTSPKAYTGLADGAHTFQVSAIDSSGRTDPTPATSTWTVAVPAPDTTITGGPAAATNATTASFTFTAAPSGGTFQCELDGAAFAACTSPKAYTGLASGSHTFQVRAIDSSGRTDPTPATSTWTVDTTAPDTTITGGPSGTTTATTATFTFTATEAGSTFECKLDSAAYAACTTPKAYSGLAKSSHTFSVRAKDPAGNTDASPATRTWRVN